MIDETKSPFPVKGTWSIQKGKLKEKFPSLTDEDLRYENGKKDDMLNRIQVKVGKTKEEFEVFMSSI